MPTACHLLNIIYSLVEIFKTKCRLDPGRPTANAEGGLWRALRKGDRQTPRQTLDLNAVEGKEGEEVQGAANNGQLRNRQLQDLARTHLRGTAHSTGQKNTNVCFIELPVIDRFNLYCANHSCLLFETSCLGITQYRIRYQSPSLVNFVPPR